MTPDAEYRRRVSTEHRVEPETVSVVVPAYNAAATLGSSLASILDQSHASLEVLVIDDGSTDSTAEIIDRAVRSDHRVVAIGDGTNHGRSAARNAGIDAATGDWVAFVDADDLLHRDRFARLLEASRSVSGCRVVTDDRWGFTVGPDGTVAMQHRFPARHTWRLGGHQPLDVDRHFTDRFGHLDVMVERAALLSVGARFPEDLEIGEDLACYLTLLFTEPSLKPVRSAMGSYYYRLGQTSRGAGGADTWQLVIDRVVEQTGSAHLRALADRWQPVHSSLYERADAALAAEGRLGERRIPPDPQVHANARAGFAWLVSVKALQWAGRWQDRVHQPHAAADLAAQLARTV